MDFFSYLKVFLTKPTTYSNMDSQDKLTYFYAMNREEPAVSYKWTNWVWDTTGWSSKFQETLPVILDESIKHTSN